MTVLSYMALQCHTGNVHEQGSGFQKTSRVQQGVMLSLALNFLQRPVLAFPESDHFYTCLLQFTLGNILGNLSANM